MVDTNNSNSGLKCKEEVGQREIFNTYSLEEKEHGEANSMLQARSMQIGEGLQLFKGLAPLRKDPALEQ